MNTRPWRSNKLFLLSFQTCEYWHKILRIPRRVADVCSLLILYVRNIKGNTYRPLKNLNDQEQRNAASSDNSSLLILFTLWKLHLKVICICMISGFRWRVNVICVLLGSYVAYNGSLLPTFRDNLSVPSSRLNKLKKGGLYLRKYIYGWDDGDVDHIIIISKDHKLLIEAVLSRSDYWYRLKTL
jgi:hypothetical protein